MGAVYNGSITLSRKDDLDYLLMCNVYEEYIVNHKANVKDAYKHLLIDTDYSDRLPSDINIDDWNYAIEQLEDEIEHHDDSKFSDEEFEPYRRHFDKTKLEEAEEKADSNVAQLVEDEYNRAWVHHYLVNPHHPEFWNHTDMINGKLVPSLEPRSEGPRDMDLLNILHMICDWSGMSLKFRNKYSPISWYNKEATDERRAMSSNTKHKLFLILSMMFPEEEVIE